MTTRFRYPLNRHIPTLIIICCLNSLIAQQHFQAAAYESQDLPTRINKIEARLKRDIATLPEMPKDQKAVFIKEYTERSDSIKSDLRSGHFLMDTLWENWFQGIMTEIWRGNPGLPANEVHLYIGRGEDVDLAADAHDRQLRGDAFARQLELSTHVGGHGTGVPRNGAS